MSTNRELVDQAWEAIQDGNAVAKGLLDQVVDVPPQRTFEFRGLYDILRGSYPAIFHKMGLNAIQAYQNPTGPDYQLVRVFDQIANGDVGWTWMGGYNASATTMKISTAKLKAVMAYRGSLGLTVAEHPRNSHVYVMTDDDQMVTITEANKISHLNAIANFCELVHSQDPKAVCLVVDWKQERIMWYSDKTLGRPICNGILLDGYPNNASGYLETRIADQAKWAEAAGKPYDFAVSVHDNNGQPAFPTPEKYNKMVDQIAATKAGRLFHYVWDDGTPPSLATEPTMQMAVGKKMLQFTPS